MKRLHTGVLVFDIIDIICISFSFGSLVAYLNRKRQERKKIDPIVSELKRECALVRAVNVDGTPMKPIKPTMIRGGAEIPVNGRSLTIKSKKLAKLVAVILRLNRKYKTMKLLQIFFLALNASLTNTLGLRFAVGGSLDYTQFILIAFPATVGGFLMGQVIANPLASVFLPLAIVYGRGIEDIPDPSEKCKLLCKYAEQYHNKELMIEMKNLRSAIEDASLDLKLPLECVEEKLSLLERFKLRQLIESEKAKDRVQHFSKFIKNFPECNADPEAVYEQVVEKTTN